MGCVRHRGGHHDRQPRHDRKCPIWPTTGATAPLPLLHAIFVYVTVLFPRMAALVKGKAILLVRGGMADFAAMRRHGVGMRDLEEAPRCHGIAEIAKVNNAMLERNGTISVTGRHGA